MRIVQGVRTLQSPDLADLAPQLRSSCVTIGNFDGMHLGHRALLERLKAHLKHQPGTPGHTVVMTFEPHPIKVLYPERHLHRIFDIEDQVDQLKILGIDMLVIEPFSREFSQLAPERFLKEWLIEPFHPTAIVVGYDFSFGAGRKGSIDFLENRAGTSSYALEVVPPVKVGDIVVSSTRIRQALSEGDVSLASRLLGRHFYIKGIVEKGAGRGRKIGIPTANLHTSAETVPARGVYAAWAEFGGKRWKAAVNIGVNPTFTQGQTPSPTIEAHVIGFPHETDLYGENIRLEFVQRLRNEHRFDGVDALIAQIRADIQMAVGCLEQDRLHRGGI